MGTSLTDQDLAAYVSGSATPKQLKAWMSHIATCDACSKKVASQDGEAPEPPKPASDSTSTSGITPGTRLGDFEIEKRIGSGGMGIVYQARQVWLSRRRSLDVGVRRTKIDRGVFP